MSVSKSRSRQKSTPIISEANRKILSDQSARAERVLGTSGITGPLVAGSNQNIELGQQMALDQAGNLGNIGQTTAQGFNQLANFGTELDPVLQQRLQDIQSLTNRNLQENILPSLRTGAVQAGQVGSSRQGIAEGIAARGAAEAAAREQTNLLAGQQQNRLSALQSLGGAAQGATQALLQPAQTIGAVGAQQRGIQNELAQEQLLRQQAEIQRLTGLGNLNQQAIAPTIGQTTSGSQTSMDFDLGQIASGVAGAVALGAI